MKYILLAGLCICAMYANSAAQQCSVKLDRDTIDFKTILTNDKISEPLTIQNSGPSDLLITEIRLGLTDTVFSSASQGSLPIPPGATHTVLLSFQSKHNLSYQGAAFFRLRCGLDEFTLPVVLKATRKYSDSTYSFTQSISGEALKIALKNYVSNHTSLTYKDARTAMFSYIDNVGGEVECVYTGRKIAATGIPDVTATSFNTEHTWPQSKGADDEPERSDLNHIFPTDETANSRRASFPFGFVLESQACWTVGGSKLQCSTKFETRDVHKGNLARAMFYFSVRYGNPFNYMSEQNQEIPLRQWSKLDTVDAREMARNNEVEKLQKRRNPFIDHPEFIDRISSFTANGDFPLQPAIIGDERISIDVRQGAATIPLYIYNSGTSAAMISQTSFFGENTGVFTASVPDSIIEPNTYSIITLAASNESAQSESVFYNISFKENIPLLAIKVRALKGVVGIAEEKITQPEIALEQNYPNPVESETVIRFKAHPAQTVLKLYTMQGQEILDATQLIQWQENSGSITFNKDFLRQYGNVIAYRLITPHMSAGKNNDHTIDIFKKKNIPHLVYIQENTLKESEESEQQEQPEQAPKKAAPKRKKKAAETTAPLETTAGTLYLVSTPIGNNDDITLRALTVLKQCDMVISEEAKVAAPLLHAHSISKPIEELNEHNEEEAAGQYIELLKSGKNLALMSDAGTPLLADPGLVLVRKALKENIPISVVPGASSVLTALVRSGFDGSQFVYAGFLNRRPEERESELRKLAGEPRTVILLETPYRLKPVLEAAAKVMPGRRAYLGCNLTMPFETHHYGTFAELWEKFEDERFKGEFVIVFEKPSDRSPFKKQDQFEEGAAPLRRRPIVITENDDEEETEDDKERMTLLDSDEIDVDDLEESADEDAPRPRFDRQRERTKDFSRGGESRGNAGYDRPRESRGGDRREGGFKREGGFSREGGPRREGGGFGGGERRGGSGGGFKREGGFSREGGPRREGGGFGGGPRREGGFGGGERRPFSREGAPSREGGFARGGNREGGNYNRSGGFGREGGGNREGGPRREGGFKREGGFSREGGPRREGGGGFGGGGERRPFNREGGGGFKGGNSSRGGGFGGDRRRDDREGGGGEDRPRRNFGDNPFSGGGAKGGFKKPFKKR